MKASIQKLEKETRNLQKPVDELVKKRDLLVAKRDRELQNNEDWERKNQRLRKKVDLPENEKESV